MPMMIVHQTVDDFEAWKKRFEETSHTRRAKGARGARRFRGLDNPNEIFVIIDWDTVEHGAAYFGLKAAAGAALDPKGPIFMEELDPLDG